ncbi:hypothetical protein [Mesorhizobium sp. J8]|uniref:hypothetical protein n=1 Tax=Mesorhizobium sp. J8 TaxID=2777475 RepID=UPI001916430E|nr:hypothetical protein [Mesorhizobium sp. J8]BCM19175.1 hypothetical protein MJ8_29470 [Mesorhizobium sp. J8]
MRAVAHRLLIAATLAGTLSSAHGMEITREQCELIRRQLIAGATDSQNSHEALKEINLASFDLALLKFELEQIGGEKVRIVTDRLQKNLDAIAAATKHSTEVKSYDQDGLLAFMTVCGPPPS